MTRKLPTMKIGASWAAIGFYGLVAFEFFYMFSPFAAYLYSVYGPGLGVIESSPWVRPLARFFMPHIVRETRSWFVTNHEVIGLAIFVLGLAVFVWNAFRIYWGKVRQSGAVLSGAYATIRHPQYLGLMISSLGMTLVWPRFLAVVGFVTVCLAYIVLAKHEEGLCKRAFPEYEHHTRATGMFFPRSVERVLDKASLPTSPLWRFVSAGALYLAVLALALGFAVALRNHAIGSIYTYSGGPSQIYVSVGRMGEHQFEELIQVARTNPEVASVLSKVGYGIHYVMPADLYISEVPMTLPGGARYTHQSPSTQDQSRYKIIFTRAVVPSGVEPKGVEILKQASGKQALLEVWIDRRNMKVSRVVALPPTGVYGDLPVPLY